MKISGGVLESQYIKFSPGFSYDADLIASNLCNLIRFSFSNKLSIYFMSAYENSDC